jgi:hypothetical protein
MAQRLDLTYDENGNPVLSTVDDAPQSVPPQTFAVPRDGGFFRAAPEPPSAFERAAESGRMEADANALPGIGKAASAVYDFIRRGAESAGYAKTPATVRDAGLIPNPTNYGPEVFAKPEPPPHVPMPPAAAPVLSALEAQKAIAPAAIATKAAAPRRASPAANFAPSTMPSRPLSLTQDAPEPRLSLTADGKLDLARPEAIAPTTPEDLAEKRADVQTQRALDGYDAAVNADAAMNIGRGLGMAGERAAAMMQGRSPNFEGLTPDQQTLRAYIGRKEMEQALLAKYDAKKQAEEARKDADRKALEDALERAAGRDLDERQFAWEKEKFGIEEARKLEEGRARIRAQNRYAGHKDTPPGVPGKPIERDAAQAQGKMLADQAVAALEDAKSMGDKILPSGGFGETAGNALNRSGIDVGSPEMQRRNTLLDQLANIAASVRSPKGARDSEVKRTYDSMRPKASDDPAEQRRKLSQIVGALESLEAGLHPEDVAAFRERMAAIKAWSDGLSGKAKPAATQAAQVATPAPAAPPLPPQPAPRAALSPDADTPIRGPKAKRFY